MLPTATIPLPFSRLRDLPEEASLMEKTLLGENFAVKLIIMAYDKMNRLISRTYPNGDHEHFVYDANGNQVAKVDGEGDSAVYTYDSRNRETLRRFTNSGHTVEARYTVDGKPDTVVDHRGMTVYAYDVNGREASVTNPDCSFIESRYDPQGNRTVQKATLDSTFYGYDSLNRMTTVSSLSGVETNYFYNDVGNRDSVINANGTSARYGYDDLNRLASVTNYAPDGSVQSSYIYELNNAGIRKAVTEADGSRVDYAYDNCYKLTGETRTGGSTGSPSGYSITYTYDNVGNRNTQNRNGITTSYVYNTRDQVTSEDSAGVVTTYAYDAAGRMTGKTVAGVSTTYGWEDNDRMVSVNGPGVAISYIYDHNGQRVSEATASDTVCYLIDYQLPYGQVVAETDGDGNVVATYVYGLDRISMERGGNTFTYATDGQGSVRQLTSGSGSVTDAYYYTAFGEELAKTGSTENRFRYVGEQWDVNAGFYYNRARWYSPEQGRFTAVDPVLGQPREPITMHRYIYTKNNPISFIDPSGNNYTLVGLMVGMGVSSVLAANAMPIFKQMIPPTGYELSTKPNVKSEIESSWRASDVNDSRKRHEEGGWIYMNPANKDIVTRRGTSGTQISIDLSYPPILPEYYVVGDFHTHPNPTSEGCEPGPSPDDISGQARIGVPGIIRSDQGANQLHIYGPLMRNGFIGSRGYPSK